MKSEDINRILGITESFELPNRLMTILEDKETRIEIMDRFMSLGETLDHDWFTEYFEEQHANKSKMAQDFTPEAVGALAARIIGHNRSVADVCAGTGGLMIAVWNQSRETKFVCYELSNRTIPLLLLNLAIRNIQADVIREDVLTGEVFERYRVLPGEKYGCIVQGGTDPEPVDAVISNPPYSLKYKPLNDHRFEEFQNMLPSNFADYVFIAFAMTIMKPEGKAALILPHGVLFRGNKEGEFRKHLIENKKIRTVIGLPDKLFINTDIPTMILEIDQRGTGDGVFFIEAKTACTKDRSKNVIDKKSFQKIWEAYDNREDIERFTAFVPYCKIRQNGYNMNIPRYVDTFVPDEIPELEDILGDLARLEDEAFETKIELLHMMRDLAGTTPEADKKYKKALSNYRRTLTKKDKEYRQEVLKL